MPRLVRRSATHPLVRKIGFTGGTETARHVMRAAAGTIKNITLELGGDEPAIVLDDVDIESSLDRKLNGIVTRTGQICFAVKRIYVPRNMYDDFVEALANRFSNLNVGHGLDPRSDLGPLNNKKQYESVTDIIQRTKDSSAKVSNSARSSIQIIGTMGFTYCHMSSGMWGTRRPSPAPSSSVRSFR